MSTDDPILESLTEEARAALMACASCDGIEVNEEDWPVAQTLVDADLAVWASGARGPGREWKRLELSRKGQRLLL